MGAKKQKIDVSEWSFLSELGFHASSARSGVWELDEPIAENGSAAKVSSDAWFIRYLSIDTNRERAQLQECEVFLPFSNIAGEIAKSLSQEFEQEVVCDVCKSKDSDILVSVNCPTKNKSSSLCPQSFLGFKFFVHHSRGALNLYFYDHYAVNMPPKNVFNKLSQSVQHLVLGKAAEKFKIFKPAGDFTDFLSKVFEDFFAEFEQEGLVEKLGKTLEGVALDNFLVSVSDNGIRLSYVFQHETGCRPHVVGLPINALEVTELADDYVDTMEFLSQEDYLKAFRSLEKISYTDTPKLELDFLGYIGLNSSKQKEVFQLLEQTNYRNSTVAWSFVLNYYIKTKQYEKALAEMSPFAAELLKSAPESLVSHGLVLAETLGDLWSQKDPAIAHRFYRTILKKFGDIPRILNKVVAISSKNVGPDEEIILLKKTLKLSDSEHGNLIRLSDLYAEQGKLGEAIHFGLKALQGDDASIELVTKLTSLYIKQNQVHQALQFLKDYTEYQHFNAHELAQLNILAGDLWSDHLNRPQLAQRRYMKALEIAPDYKPAYEKMEVVYDRSQQWEVLAGLLSKKIEVFGAEDTTIMGAYLKLCHITEEQKLEPAGRWRSFELMLMNGFFVDAEVERASLEDEGNLVDWAKVAKIIEERLKSDSENDMAKSSRLALLAKIYHTKLGRVDMSVNYLEKANQFSKIETNAFKFLLKNADEGSTDVKPGKMIFDRFNNLENDDKKKLLADVDVLPIDIEFSELKVLAIQQYKLNDGQENLISSIYEDFIKESQAEQLESFVDEVLVDLEEGYLKKKFCFFTLDYLSKSEFGAKPPIIVKLLDQLEPEFEDQHSYLEMVSTYVCGQADEKYGKYIKRALEAHVEELFSDADIAASLKNEPKFVSQYWLGKARTARVPLKSRQYAKQSLELLKSAENPDSKIIESCYAIMGCHGYLSALEIGEYRTIVRETGEWGEFLLCLKTQLEEPGHAGRKAKWCVEIGDIYLAQSDMVEALHYYKMSLELEGASQEVFLKIAEVANVLKDAKQEIWAYKQVFIGVNDFASDENIEIFESCERLISSDEFMQMTTGRIQSLIDEGALSTAQDLLRLLQRRNVLPFELLMLLAKVSASDEECLESLVTATLYVETALAWREYIVDAEHILDKINLSIEDLYARLLTEFSTEKYADSVCLEVYIYFAYRMYNQQDSSVEAYEYFKEAFALDRMDSRVWLPYYILMREQGDGDEQIAYLEFIIPCVEKEEHLFEDYPLTLETLRVDLSALTQKEILDENVDGSEAAPGAFSEEKTYLYKVDSQPSDSKEKPDKNSEKPKGIAGPKTEEAQALVMKAPEEVVAHAEAEEVSEDVLELDFDLDRSLKQETGDEEAGDEPTVIISSNTLKTTESEPEEVELVFDVNQLSGQAELENSSLADEEIEQKVEEQENDAVPKEDVVDLEFSNKNLLGSQKSEAASEDVSVLEEAIAGTSLDSFEMSLEDISQVEAPLTGITQLEARQLEGSDPEALTSLSGKVYNWRILVEEQNVEEKAVAKLIRTPFESELEKHIALQSLAVLSGDYLSLKDWHMSVWRNASEWSYSTDAGNRIEYGELKSNLETDFYKFLVHLTPVLIGLYDQRFTFAGMARQLQVTPQSLLKACVPRTWDNELLAAAGLAKYAPRLVHSGYRVFHLAGLGESIFYDGRTRSLYFDETYYCERPPGRLLFGILTEIWGVRLGYHVALNLKAKEEIFPVLKNIIAYSKMTQIQRAKIKITQRKNPLVQFLSQASPGKLESYVNIIRGIEARDIAKMQFAMEDHLYKLLLAESLNLIGLLEFVTQKDLINGSVPFSYMDLVRISPHVESLVNFTTQLKV